MLPLLLLLLLLPQPLPVSSLLSLWLLCQPRQRFCSAQLRHHVLQEGPSLPAAAPLLQDAAAAAEGAGCIPLLVIPAGQFRHRQNEQC
jgi:hypothetical protein